MDIHGRGQAVVVLPDPGMDAADASLQQVLWPVQMLRQSYLHPDGQGQHAAKISGITIVVLEPPADEMSEHIRFASCKYIVGYKTCPCI